MGIVSDRMRQLREEQYLKQINVADDLKIPRGTYASYERGSVPPPALLGQIADYYHVSVDWLIGHSDDRNPAAASKLAAALSRIQPSGFTAEAIMNFCEAAAVYNAAGRPCGSAPLEAAVSYLGGLTYALRAAAQNDLAGTIAGSDTAIGAALTVHKMPEELLKRGE